MKIQRSDIKIKNIPAVLWGEPSARLFIVVHGNMSRKDDDAVVILAEEAAAKGYRVLSFDLPEHGDRKGGDYACTVQNCVSDLGLIRDYALTAARELSLFACSMGAYFSLLAYRDLALKECLFLSPVVDMERLIGNMMKGAGVSEERLKAEKEIKTPYGPLYWDYYWYVKTHPVDAWAKPTAILYGSADNVSEPAAVAGFAARFNCKLTELERGEHYFHTPEQLGYFRQWLKGCI